MIQFNLASTTDVTLPYSTSDDTALLKIYFKNMRGVLRYFSWPRTSRER